MLTSHAKAEEKTFYNILKKKADAGHNEELNDIMLEGFQEHHVADELLNELINLEPSDEKWMAKMTVLEEVLDHHIKEEEDDMFSDAKEELETFEIKAIGANFLNKQTEIADQIRLR